MIKPGSIINWCEPSKPIKASDSKDLEYWIDNFILTHTFIHDAGKTSTLYLDEDYSASTIKEVTDHYISNGWAIKINGIKSIEIGVKKIAKGK